MIHGMVRAQNNKGDVNLIVLLNSYTGTKNVAKSMKSIAIGAVKRAGKTWFPELSDKSMVHFY